MASILSKKQKKKKKKEEYTLKDLKSLGHDLLTSRSHINNLPLLLTFVSPESQPQFVVESLLSLQSFFSPLLSQLPSTSSSPSSTKRPRSEDNNPEVVFKFWLRSKFDELVKLLLDVLSSQHSEDALRGIVFDTLMEFVKLLNVGKFHSSIYHRLLHSIIHSAVDVEIFLDILTTKYFKYDDVRYFTYISMEMFVKKLEASVSADRSEIENSETENDSKESLELSVRKIYQVLSQIPPPEKQTEKSDHEMWSGSDESHSEKLTDKKKKTKEQDSTILSPTKISKRMKLKFTKAWLSFLRLPLPLDVFKEVLASIHQTVIPHLSNPTMLCDFLTKSYDIGGVVSVMALSSLFILMTQHGLEYPNFYEKLYALLVPSVFVAKYRSKFLQLLDACLKSSMLPAYLAASFTKKLSRLSLSIPPAGSLVVTALIYNLLRRHPTINYLVQETVINANEANIEADNEANIEADNEANIEADNEANIEADEHNESEPKTNKKQKLGIDYFNNQESDPKKSGALKSSLWEIDTLRHHYCPPVSRFISSLETDLTIRAKTTEMKIEDYSSGSYATIFGDEIRRRVKQVPLAFYKVIPTSLFEDSDFPGWTFTIPQEEDGKF